MLEIVFDRLLRMMSTSLRNLTSDNVEVSLDSITSIRFGDYLETIPMPAMLSVFKAEEWDNFGLMVVDSGLIYSIVDVLLGGRRGTAAMRIEGRPYTTIERNLVERMVTVVLSDMSAAFDPVSPVTFVLTVLRLIQDLLRSLDLLTRRFWHDSELIWRTEGVGSSYCFPTQLWSQSENFATAIYGRKVWTRSIWRLILRMNYGRQT